MNNDKGVLRSGVTFFFVGRRDGGQTSLQRDGRKLFYVAFCHKRTETKSKRDVRKAFVEGETRSLSGDAKGGRGQLRELGRDDDRGNVE
jgi:hypothetical protein